MGILLLLVLVWSNTYGQGRDIPFEKQYFKGKEAQFKEAKKALDEGYDLFEKGKVFYRKALPYLMKAYSFNPDNALLNYRIGKCILEAPASPNRKECLPYFQKAYQLNPNVERDIFYMLAQGYHLNMKWDEAINEYERYLRVLPADAPVGLREEVLKKIEECKTGKELTKKPARVFIENLGRSINTEYPEYGPVITADGSVLMFTSRRPNTTGGKIDEDLGEPYEDIYMSERKGKEWTPAVNLPEPVNSSGHDAVITLSPDGNYLIIYKYKPSDGGDLYISQITKEGWSKPKPLKGDVNTPYHEAHASFGPDMKVLYFVSNRPDGFGQHDIWRSFWDEKKKEWGKAENLGPVINTKYDEHGVYIHSDGVTLYFSSTGHKTMGGYDIFVSRYSNGVWSEPENLGYPINTPDDDVFLVVVGSGRYGYYSSYREDGFGEKDIYRIIFLGPEKPLIPTKEEILLAWDASPTRVEISEPKVEVSTSKVTLFKGYVLDEKTKEPVEASIELVDNSTGRVVGNYNSNPRTGRFLVVLHSGKNYGIAISAPGYLFHSENFDIPEEAAYKEVNKTIYLKKLEVGATIVLRNIFFDYDKATLRPESKAELDRVYDLLVKNPTLKIELSGHTDDIGSDEYNMKLSQKRAESAMAYLVQKGIDPSRIKAVGYGETQPMVPNTSEENRQLNRRVELKVIAK